LASKPKLITQPAEWWAAFDAAAKREKLTLSEWLGNAGLAQLPDKIREKLPPRPAANRPAKA